MTPITSIKHPDNLAEGIIVRDRNTDEPVGEVLIYEQDGLIEIDVKGPPEETIE